MRWARSVVLAVGAAGLVPCPVARASAPVDGLRVVEVSPQGDVMALDQDVCVVFDRPLREEGYSRQDRLRIEPPVEGMFVRRFGDRICLRGTWLAAATSYRVSLVGEVVARDGSVYAGPPVVWTFTTPRPEVWGYAPSLPQARDEGVELSLSADVSVTELRRRVRAYAHPLGKQYAFLATVDPDDANEVTEERLAQARRGRPIAVEVKPRDPDDRDYYVVRGRGGWPAGARIAVVVEAGLTARAGPLASLSPFVLEFETAADQRIVGESCADRSACPIGPLVISLWQAPLDLAEHPVVVEPRPDGLRIDETNDDDIVVEGAFVAGQTYTVTIPHATGKIVRRYTFTREPSVELSSRAAILDPDLPRTVGVTSRHLERIAVRVARLGDGAARELVGLAERGEALPWPDRLVARVDREYPVTPAGVNQWADTVIDLRELVGDMRGALLVEARGLARVGGGAGRLPPPSRAVVQVTNLTAIAVVTPYRSILEVVGLGGGEARSGVQVGRFGTSDARGIVELTGAKRTEPEVVVLADPSGDRGYVTLPAAVAGEDAVIGSIVTTRAMGRPGESLSVLGWTAIDTPRVAGGLRRVPAGTWIEVSLRHNGRVLATRRTQTDADGAFTAQLEVPRYTVTEAHRVVAQVVGARRAFAGQPLWVARYDLSRPHIRAEPLDIEVDTPRAALRVEHRDEHGAPRGTGSLAVDLNCRRIRFRPPGVEHRWQIGQPEPRYSHGDHRRIDIHRETVDRQLASVFEVERVYLDLPRRCHASVVMSRELAAETAYLLHPSAYLGIAVPGDPRAGAAAAVVVRAFDHDGVRVGSRGVRVAVEHAGFNDWFGEYDESDAPPVTRCTLDLAATGDDARCSLGELVPGRYRVLADGGRARTTVAEFYVAGSGLAAGPTDARRPTALVVEAGRWIRPGEVRAVRIRAAWDAGPGLLWASRGGLLAAVPFVLRGGEAVVMLTAADSWVPGVEIGVAAVRPATASEPVRLEHDITSLEIAGEGRRLAVEVEAAEVVATDGRTDVRVRVRDDRGRPVAGRLDAWMIDEAELALGYYPFAVAAPLPAMHAAAAPVAALATARPPFVARTTDLVSYPWPAWRGRVGRGGGGATGGKWRPDRYGRRPFVAGPPPLLGVRLDARGEATLALDTPREPAAMRLFVVATADLADGRGPGRLGKADVTMHARAAR